MVKLTVTGCILSFLAITALAQPGHSVSESGFILPPGFTITEVAGPELANDIYCLTISPEGYVIVSGRGYLKQLVDDNNDGVFDRAILLADYPKDGAMGLFIENDFFYFMGDGGLRRMPWNPGTFTTQSELLIKLKTGGEHDAHAITRGPDGWLYVLCGNTAGVTAQHASMASSPIKTHTAGCVLRIAPDFKNSEIICDGFRNPYGFDWNMEGELFTFDSDNERCMGLPWYEGCRFYRIERGGHYGWRSPQKGQFWRMPPYHPDIVAPLLDLGRGSPTGVVCYQHQQFPKSYQGAFFLLDWTFGVIHCVRLKENTVQSEPFLKVTAGNGFAPTAAAVHPQTGDLYVSTGGRGTRGAVYRIRHEAGFKSLPPNVGLQKPVHSAKSLTLHEPQQLSLPSRHDLLKSFTSSTSTKEKLRSLCLLMDHLGNIEATSVEYSFKEGYQLVPHQNVLNDKPFVHELLVQLRSNFPSSDAALNREISRAMALLQDDSPITIDKIVSQITANSSPVDDMHYLFVLACCPAKRSAPQTEAIAQALIQLDAKYDRAKLQHEYHWSLRLSEVVRALLAHDPHLKLAIVKHPELGRPNHLLLVMDSQFPRPILAQLWLNRISQEKDYPWSANLVALLATAPLKEVLSLFRRHWDDPTLQDVILPTLAKAHEAEDRRRFVSSLRSISKSSIKLALEGLNSLPDPIDNELMEELAACAKAIQYWHKLDESVGVMIQRRLRTLTHTDELRDPKGWTGWVIEHYPGLKAQLESSDGVDRAKWDSRLKNIDWSSGRVDAGEALFRKHCAACHQGTSAVGPDLAGLSKRFSHDDIVTAVLQPSKDVPARYRTTIFTTHSGQTLAGLVIYEAVDGAILQTATATVRIAGNDIAGKRTSEQSLMPAGLLDNFSDQQVADLLTWLKR